jgi:hypothetical protein
MILKGGLKTEKGRMQCILRFFLETQSSAYLAIAALFSVFHHRQYFFRQVSKAIDSFNILKPSQEVLVCVSGGKDGLVLWGVLMELGYQAKALYIDLMGSKVQRDPFDEGYLCV